MVSLGEAEGRLHRDSVWILQFLMSLKLFWNQRAFKIKYPLLAPRVLGPLPVLFVFSVPKIIFEQIQNLLNTQPRRQENTASYLEVCITWNHSHNIQKHEKHITGDKNKICGKLQKSVLQDHYISMRVLCHIYILYWEQGLYGGLELCNLGQMWTSCIV